MARDPGVDVYRGVMWVLCLIAGAWGMCTGSPWALIPAAVGLVGLYAVRHPA